VIVADSVADLNLEELTRDDFPEWRDRLLEGRQPHAELTVRPPADGIRTCP